MNSSLFKSKLKLIDLFHNNECLWKANLRTYKNYEDKEKVYMRIALLMKWSDNDVKKQIRKLRAKYVYERRNFLRRQSLAGNAVAERPRWCFYDKLSFLDKVVTNRQRTIKTKKNGSAKSQDIQSSLNEYSKDVSVEFQKQIAVEDRDNSAVSNSLETTNEDIDTNSIVESQKQIAVEDHGDTTASNSLETTNEGIDMNSTVEFRKQIAVLCEEAYDNALEKKTDVFKISTNIVYLVLKEIEELDKNAAHLALIKIQLLTSQEFNEAQVKFSGK